MLPPAWLDRTEPNLAKQTAWEGQDEPPSKKRKFSLSCEKSLAQRPTRFFACPFFKAYPDDPKLDPGCRKGRPTFHRVKEHLLRKHTPDENKKRNENEQSDEKKNSDPPVKRTSQPGDGKQHRLPKHLLIDERCRRELASKSKRMLDTEKWQATYQLLFPDSKTIPSPFDDIDSIFESLLKFAEGVPIPPCSTCGMQSSVVFVVVLRDVVRQFLDTRRDTFVGGGAYVGSSPEVEALQPFPGDQLQSFQVFGPAPLPFSPNMDWKFGRWNDFEDTTSSASLQFDFEFGCQPVDWSGFAPGYSDNTASETESLSSLPGCIYGVQIPEMFPLSSTSCASSPESKETIMSGAVVVTSDDQQLLTTSYGSTKASEPAATTPTLKRETPPHAIGAGVGGSTVVPPDIGRYDLVVPQRHSRNEWSAPLDNNTYPSPTTDLPHIWHCNQGFNPVDSSHVYQASISCI